LLGHRHGRLAADGPGRGPGPGDAGRHRMAHQVGRDVAEEGVEARDVGVVVVDGGGGGGQGEGEGGQGQREAAQGQAPAVDDRLARLPAVAAADPEDDAEDGKSGGGGDQEGKEPPRQQHGGPASLTGSRSPRLLWPTVGYQYVRFVGSANDQSGDPNHSGRSALEPPYPSGTGGRRRP